MRTKDETIRRLRLGNIKTLLRSRCGYELPDDDAGREYLRELLLPISLGPEADLKMANIAEIWAPWMDAKERFDLVAEIERTPPYLRKVTGKALGERLRVTSAERIALRLWTIAACDATDEQRDERHKAANRGRQQRRRRRLGMKPRTKPAKPWQAEGISRAKYYRRRETRTSQRETPVSRTKASIFL